MDVRKDVCLVMHLQSDQTRGEVTSCKCVGWSVVDRQLAAVAPDMMQRSPPWPLHRWKSLLLLTYIKKKKRRKKMGPTNHLLVASLITLSKLTFVLPINLYSPYCKDSLSCGIEAPSSS